MKRYGYKFERDDGGPAKFDHLRAYILFAPIVLTAIEVVVVGAKARPETQSIITIYIGVGFLLILATMLAEILPKTGIALLSIPSLAISGACVWFTINEGFQPLAIIMSFYLSTTTFLAVWFLLKVIKAGKIKQEKV